MTALLVGWLAALCVSVLHIASTVMVSRGLGVRAGAARVFIGPPIVRRTLGGVEFQLGAIPLPSSFVAFSLLDDPSPPVDLPNRPDGEGDEADAERTTLDEATRIRRVAIVLVPWLIIVALTMPLLGPIEAWESMGRGLVQIVHGAVQPFDVGAPFLASYFETFRASSSLAFGAALATKIVAFNLLPLPGTAGQHTIYRGFTDRPLPPRWLGLVVAVLGACILIGWSVAIYAYVAG